jgi:hypothetical protein
MNWQGFGRFRGITRGIMVRLVGKDNESPRGVSFDISGATGRNKKKGEMVMDSELTLNAVVTISTAGFINKNYAFCPKYDRGSYTCHIVLRLLDGCNP